MKQLNAGNAAPGFVKKLILRVAVLMLGCTTLFSLWGCASKGAPEYGQPMSRGPRGETMGLADPSELMRQSSPRTTYSGAPTGMSAIIPGQTTPPRDEELWVISRNDPATAAAPDDQTPGSGALMARVPDGGKITTVPIPLKHTDVQANISGYIASVDVTQQFHNPFNSKIEALYVFPLPHNAAINEFVMTIGDRKIRGIIRGRAEAEKIYQAARQQGYTASLLTQERPNIFTQAVANIEPGKQIDISIRYFHTLAYVDGWYEWHFPMVVGPRFNPPAQLAMNDTPAANASMPLPSAGIGAVARGAHGASGQKVEVQYLKPTERSGHDISLAVNLQAGVKIEELAAPSHRTDLRSEGSAADLKLSASDSIPNKDFVLRYRVAGDKLKSALLTSRDEKGGYFTLMLYPPKSLEHLPPKALELVFVIDVSGSMSGRPLAQANSAVSSALKMMRADDTFQIIKFASDAQLMSDKPLTASPENVRRGLAYLDENFGGGGTMMIEGIDKALRAPADPSRLRFVCFLTDGFIGNEREILGAIHARLGTSRIFSFGVGDSVNRYLLDHMAKMGRGAAAYLSLEAKAEPVMEAFFHRISHPALIDIAIDFGGMRVSEVFPESVPDLFVGRPVILTGKFTGSGKATVHVKGRAAGEISDTPLAINLDDGTKNNPALRPIWARMKVSELADRSCWQSVGDLAGQIKNLALEHGLMSAYTAFVAVDATRRTDGTFGTTVAFPVPMPEGVKYENTVPEK